MNVGVAVPPLRGRFRSAAATEQAGQAPSGGGQHYPVLRPATNYVNEALDVDVEGPLVTPFTTVAR
ncbi:hypothetical protein [Streptomyces sp. TBY4]|uniref:hypothetical protein n=1 Tax=Streptomyces sp. TBY4 TaxID=2962030 RepID=UPI0020B656FA|nr:hypothetical protein [Streptomyces sp. TBY4]MCP3757219.1 hypothetical protein [Streptomyces sp. TBY4]